MCTHSFLSGQCGNNTEGKFIEKAGKETFHYVEEPLRVDLFVEKDPKTKKVTPIRGVNVKEISCGNTHTVVIDDKNRAFSWGFGGYGRLGHSETGNELVPRLIKFLDGPRRGIRKIVCGGNFNLATSEIPGTLISIFVHFNTLFTSKYVERCQIMKGGFLLLKCSCTGI